LLLEFWSYHWPVSGPLSYLLLEVLLISLTGVWTFIILISGVLFKSLTGIWAFIMLTVAVLLKSLTGIWPFMILTIGCSAQIIDWYLGLYYTYCWGFCSSHWLVSAHLLFLLLGVLLISLTSTWALLYLLLGFCSSHWLYVALYYT
jgi:hypothetical protein